MWPSNASDFDPSGFRWIDANDTEQSVLSFARCSGDGSRVLVCVANLTPAPRPGYRVGLPEPGRWRQVLNTDAVAHAGSGYGQMNDADQWTEPVSWHGLAQSALLDLPPLGVIWLVHCRDS